MSFWSFFTVRKNKKMNSPYKAEWQRLYPDLPFPDPESNPNMFPQGSKVIHVDDYINPFSPSCSNISLCPRGLLDYKCQYKHECYLNLVELTVRMLGFLLASLFLLYLLGKLLSLIYKLGKSAAFVFRFVGCMSSIVRCAGLGFIGDDVIYQSGESGEGGQSGEGGEGGQSGQSGEGGEGGERRIRQRRDKVRMEEERRIRQMMGLIDLEVNLEHFSKKQVRELAELIEDIDLLSSSSEQG